MLQQVRNIYTDNIIERERFTYPSKGVASVSKARSSPFLVFQLSERLFAVDMDFVFRIHHNVRYPHFFYEYDGRQGLTFINSKLFQLLDIGRILSPVSSGVSNRSCLIELTSISSLSFYLEYDTSYLLLGREVSRFTFSDITSEVFAATSRFGDSRDASGIIYEITK